MNSNQVVDLQVRIDNIFELNIDEIISSIFVNQNYEEITIGQYSVAEYVSTFKRVFKQLKEELNENSKHLPFQYNFQNEFGNGTLDNDIQNIYANIKSKTQSSLNNTISYINRLVYYQVVNGFWNKSEKKIQEPTEIKIVELNDQLNYISKQLHTNLKSYNQLLTDYAKEKDNLQEFIKQKNDELRQISNNLESSNSNTTQINQLLNTSVSTNEKINSLLNQQNQQFENIKEKAKIEDMYFVKQKDMFETLELLLNEKNKVSEEQIKKIKKHLDYVEGQREFFEERTDYLNELIGREVGASLFETFKQRKGELEKPVNKWLWIVIVMSVFTFIAVMAIFTNIFGLFSSSSIDNITIRLISNSIKTLPFFFLLFYSIAQYNKERNFQEEYAFKSAVALTIKAYSDIISDDNLKDNLIVNSVSGIYKSPTIYRTRKTKEDNTIFDTAKSLLATALEVLKKK
ncbi:MAG: hypothetical protein P4L28_05125 [Paludibacteraceae bacterium]|nr:hypothetical protein [Paludibacteraceae bacterium]